MVGAVECCCLQRDRLALTCPFCNLLRKVVVEAGVVIDWCGVCLQDDTYTESYISTIGVDFVS